MNRHVFALLTGLTTGLCVVLAAPTFGHIGTPIPAYELPSTFEIDLDDGRLDDWPDREVLTRSDFGDLYVGVTSTYPIEDFDASIRLAWRRDPPRVYVGLLRWDDAYIGWEAGLPAAQELWRYDGLDLLVDGDHSGGDFFELGSPDNLRHAQRYFVVADSPDSGLALAVPGREWATQAPFSRWGGGAFADSSVIEVYVTPFDDLDPEGPDQSAISVLSPGRIIGLQIGLPDFDSEPGEYHGYFMVHGATGYATADRFIDVLLLSPLTETGVGVSSWARIKASLK